MLGKWGAISATTLLAGAFLLGLSGEWGEMICAALFGI